MRGKEEEDWCVFRVRRREEGRIKGISEGERRGTGVCLGDVAGGQWKE